MFVGSSVLISSNGLGGAAFSSLRIPEGSQGSGSILNSEILASSL
jgi:hypothetical protein